MATYDGRPLYLSIAAHVRDAIIDGTYPPGTQLPSDRALMDQHDVSRHVVTNAWQVLTAEGWIYGHQGRGRFVRTPPERQPFDLARPLVDGAAQVAVEVMSRPPLPAERDRWGLPLGISVLVVTHTWTAADGSTVESAETVLPSDRYTLRFG